MTRKWWFSCRRITCLVVSDKNNLVTDESAPIMRTFKGQHIKNAANWFRKIGGFKYKELKGA